MTDKTIQKALQRGGTRLAAIGIVFLLCAIHLAAQDIPSEPILRIEPGMHTSRSNSVDVDAAGELLITSSDDKTARIWDARTGEVLQILRPPIGPGNEGYVYAAAISPDGRSAALGGWTGWSFDNSMRIYIFNVIPASLPP